MTADAVADPDILVAEAEAEAAGDVFADFLRAAQDWPDRTAIVHNGTGITYQELAQRARLTGLRFQARSLAEDGPSGLMGVLVAHQPAVAEHLLGALQVGVGYCPIDAKLPVARKEALAEVLGVDQVFALNQPSTEETTLRIEFLGDDPTAADGAVPEASPDDPSYVLCTSGSTGTPKPVVVSRRAVSATVRSLRELFELTPDDRVLQFASLAWDTCLEEILPALTTGAALVFDDAAHSGSLPAFVRMLSQQAVTVVDLPTAFWHELVLYLHEDNVALPDSLRLVIIGGERVDPTRLQQWRDLDVGDVRLLNTYGCTETTMITHAVQLAGPDTEAAVAATGAEAPIGRALPHVVDHVTDDGELLVSGPALATEYLGLPDITASGFPMEDHGSGLRRWFHTGDMATVGSDGLVYSRGRADEQVKVLGVRVHPAEVEVQLNSHPAVVGAVVFGEKSLERTTLTAYVVASQDVTAAELRRYLRERLPAQFIPSKVTFVAALSYTTSGKIDRAATRRAAAETEQKERL